MRVLWERFEWILLIFLKSYFKKWISGRNNWRICKGNAYAWLWDANSTALPQSYPASIGSGCAILLEMWIIWDGRMLNYGLIGRSQNVLFNLYLIDTRIECKKINIFYSDSLPDLRPDLEASGYSAFAYMFGLQNFGITTEFWCLVVWSALGLNYYRFNMCVYVLE